MKWLTRAGFPLWSGLMNEQIRVCKDTIAAIRNFVKLGLHPGSFAVALILRDRQYAFERAHAILRADGKIIDEMIEWVNEHTPSSMFTSLEEIDQWVQHRGLRDAPHHAQMHLYLKSNWWKPVAETA